MPHWSCTICVSHHKSCSYRKSSRKAHHNSGTSIAFVQICLTIECRKYYFHQGFVDFYSFFNSYLHRCSDPDCTSTQSQNPLRFATFSRLYQTCLSDSCHPFGLNFPSWCWFASCSSCSFHLSLGAHLFRKRKCRHLQILRRTFCWCTIELLSMFSHFPVLSVSQDWEVWMARPSEQFLVFCFCGKASTDLNWSFWCCLLRLELGQKCRSVPLLFRSGILNCVSEAFHPCVLGPDLSHLMLALWNSSTLPARSEGPSRSAEWTDRCAHGLSFLPSWLASRGWTLYPFASGSRMRRHR